MTRFFSAGALAVLFACIGALFVSVASAQDACRRPACDGAGETFNRTTRNCESNAGFPTYAMSHRVPTCGADETLDRANGICVLNVCTGAGGSCVARPLCPSGWIYRRAERDAGGGVYGVCGSQSGTYLSHQVVRCEAGFTLNEARGICVGMCTTITPTPTALPDLVIRGAELRSSPSGPAIARVRRGQRYWACVEVANIGPLASGRFSVGGGGLGVPVAPTMWVTNLAPGVEREVCLAYATTPPVGSYRVTVSADPGNTVRELLNDNNGVNIAVIVIP